MNLWKPHTVRSKCSVLGVAFVFHVVGVATSAAQSARHVDRPVQLFNGVNLDGWTTWLVDTKRADPRRVFTVRDGAIRISGDGLGYLSTVRQYRDYRLTVEFKWGERNWGSRIKAARDSGLFLHSVGPDGNSVDGQGAFKAAIECQIMEGAVGDILLIKGRDKTGTRVPVGLSARAASDRDSDGWPFWDPGGKTVSLQQTGRLNWHRKDPDWKDLLGFRGRNDVQHRNNRWNTLQCTCEGANVTIRLNGVRVNEASNVQPAAGTILLQCEGSEIFFRKIELLPLASAHE